MDKIVYGPVVADKVKVMSGIEEARQADIIVSAMGQAKLVKKNGLRKVNVMMDNNNPEEKKGEAR